MYSRYSATQNLTKSVCAVKELRVLILIRGFLKISLKLAVYQDFKVEGFLKENLLQRSAASAILNDSLGRSKKEQCLNTN
jgi:hypothetical protein